MSFIPNPCDICDAITPPTPCPSRSASPCPKTPKSNCRKKCSKKDADDYPGGDDDDDEDLDFSESMKTVIAEIKYDLNDWRELLIHLNKILLWETNWHPLLIIIITTIIFSLLWLHELNALTTLAVVGLVITIADFFIPIGLKVLYSTTKWSQIKDREYAEACENLALYKTKIALLFTSYFSMKKSNYIKFLCISLASMFALFIISTRVNNLLIAYLFFTILFLLPGIEHNNIFEKSWKATKSTWSKALKAMNEGCCKKDEKKAEEKTD